MRSQVRDIVMVNFLFCLILAMILHIYSSVVGRCADSSLWAGCQWCGLVRVTGPGSGPGIGTRGLGQLFCWCP
ncbi:hypothetical protein BGW80DRAFT_1395881 [Lactifluus volemus]|nr:hypothetical protein BGW80DRAFT_1395881 [Lactifluus volemus]